MGDNKDLNSEQDTLKNQNGSDGGFSYVQEKIKPKTRKRIKKLLTVAGLALLAGVIFGFAARVTFLLAGEPVAKVLGIEMEKEPEILPPTGTIRSEVTFPTNPLTKAPTKMPTKAPTKAPTITPTTAPDTTSPTGKEDPGPSGVTGVALTETPDASPSLEARITDAPVTSVTPIEEDVTKEPAGETSGPDGDEKGGNTDQGGGDIVPTEAPSSLEKYLSMIADMREIASKAQESLVRVYSVTTGINWMDESIETKQELTGTLMGNNGVELLILSDYNMVSGADRLEAELPDGKLYDAVLFSFDTDTNMAVLAVELESIPSGIIDEIKYMQLGDSEALECGEPVIAIGRPNGYYGAMEFGYVSHTGIRGYIIDGGLVEFMTDFSFSSGGDGVITDVNGSIVGFIPYTQGENEVKNKIIGINSLKPLLLKLLNGSGVPLFGIKAEDIPADILENMGIPNGIYVNEVASGSPAADAGMKKGDVIMKIGDEEIKTVSQFYEMILGLDEGAELSVSIYRSSRPDDTNSVETVVLGSK